MSNGKLIPLEDFEDVLTSNIVLKPNKIGWNVIDIEELKVPLPNGKFLVIFYPLGEGEEVRWTEDGQEFFGNVIGIYSDYKVYNLNAARQIGGNKYAFLAPFGVNKFNIPAVVINWLKIKNDKFI